MTLLFITFTLLFSLLSASFPPLCCDGDSQVKVTQISLSYCCHQCLPSSPLGSVSDLQGEHRKFSISRWSSSEVQRKYLPGVKNLSSVPTEKLKAPIATRAGRNITKTTILIDTPEGLESSATSACWPARGSRVCWTPSASWCTTSATSAWTWLEGGRQCRGCVTTVHMAGHVSVSVPTPGQQDRVPHWPLTDCSCYSVSTRQISLRMSLWSDRTSPASSNSSKTTSRSLLTAQCLSELKSWPIKIIVFYIQIWSGLADLSRRMRAAPVSLSPDLCQELSSSLFYFYKFKNSCWFLMDLDSPSILDKQNDTYQQRKHF